VRKNKLYFILAILTVIFLFGTAAICSQCSQKEEPPGTEPVVTPPDVKPPEEPPPVEKSAHTIKLSILEGYPKYFEESGICYYRIEAEVTGSPTPDVVFSQDDSEGSWGDYIAQVNTASVDEVIVLTATATNSEGSDDASIELSWECEVENQDPVISEITLMGTKYISRTYGLGVSASDPDGDSLTYNWSVTGGTIDDAHAQDINWTTPSTYGNYTISVIVSDGKGGEDSESEDIYVHFYYDLLEEAESASWHNSTGDYHLWNVGLDDSRGFACYRTNITLEDDNIYPKVLETHPQWRMFGYIAGDYPDMEIPEGSRFTAEIGFIKGATGTDGASFHVTFVDTSYVVYNITDSSGYRAAYDGALDSLNFDLSSLAGKSGHIIIWVHAHNTSDQDWAVWVNPLITN